MPLVIEEFIRLALSVLFTFLLFRFALSLEKTCTKRLIYLSTTINLLVEP